MENRIKQFPEGEIIIREGELNTVMYKILQGHVEVYTGYGTNEETLISIIGEQACFGELGLLLHEPSIYTMVAYSAVYAMQINEDQMGEFFRENYVNMIGVMRNMASTMAAMRKHIDMLTEEIRKGNKPDESTIISARKAMKGYAMYRTMQEAFDSMGFATYTLKDS